MEKNLTLAEYLIEYKKDKGIAKEFYEHYIKKLENDKLNSVLEVIDNKDFENYPIPYLNKDNIFIEGKKCTAASKMMKNFVAPFSATITKRLKKHGANPIARMNLDEYAMGATGKTSAFGLTKSPWKNKDGEQMSSAGSGSGSAAGLAADYGLFATGTDTGGSNRLPSWNGVVGSKYTYGLVPRYGVVDFASCLDCPGFFTKTLKDSSILFDWVSGECSKDATSVNFIPQVFQKKIGYFLPEGISDEIAEIIQENVDFLVSKGYEAIKIEIPFIKDTPAMYAVLAFAEASSNLSRYSGVFYGKDTKINEWHDLYDKVRTENFGPEVQRRILTGSYVMQSSCIDGYLNQTRRVIGKMWASLKPILESVDCVLMPYDTGPGLTITESLNPDPIKMYQLDCFTCFANFLGIPAFSLPTKLSKISSTPIGLQLVGRPFSEKMIFEVGIEIENNSNFFNSYMRNLKVEI